MKKTGVIVVGAGGRMGREIVAVLSEHKSAKLFAEVGKGGVDKKLQTELSAQKGAAVVIDFSTPEGLQESIEICIKHKLPLVSGTTGIGEKEFALLKRASKVIPVFWSPNMSMGVQLFHEIIKFIGPNLERYDLQLEEFHHSKKVDKPSGTALRLQEALLQATKNKLPPVLAGRGGGIFGIHKLWIMGEQEVLTIEHTALNRRVFADGAVHAALWLRSKRPGLYSMSDLVGKK